jgi:hypothetical protein
MDQPSSASLTISAAGVEPLRTPSFTQRHFAHRLFVVTGATPISY